MMGEYTKGPWYAGHLDDANHPCNCAYILYDGHAGAIATVLVDDGKNDCPPLAEARANMRLIAAAPDLLEALEALDYCIGNGSGDDAFDAACAKAGAAIAKAKGEI